MNGLDLGLQPLFGLVLRGGPVMGLIVALSVLGLTVIFWKTWRFARLGLWGARSLDPALDKIRAGDVQGAQALLAKRRSLDARLLNAAITARQTRPDSAAREEVTRQARAALTEARTGLRLLDMIATIAPLLGLLGTVLGMIEAFQALEGAGARADPSVLAGGIWAALLTTAAGMAVAIPASVAATGFEARLETLQAALEDAVTTLFLSWKGA